MESPSLDISVGVPTLGALRECLDSRLQQVTMFADNTKNLISFELVIVEVPSTLSSNSESKIFTYDSHAALGKDDVKNDPIFALASDIHEDQNDSAGTVIHN